MISDMEGTQGEINKTCGRDGYWFTFDGRVGTGTTGGTIMPGTGMGMFMYATLMPARGTSMRGVHLTGSGFTSSTDFAGTGFALASVAGTNNPYNATVAGYKGVTFWAMLGTASALNQVKFKVTDDGSDPSGKQCTGSAQMQCYDDPFTVVTLTSSWVQLSVPFTMLKTVGYGFGGPTPRAVDANAMYQMQWEFQPQNDAGAYSIDLWLDDVSFM